MKVKHFWEIQFGVSQRHNFLSCMQGNTAQKQKFENYIYNINFEFDDSSKTSQKY